MKIGAYICSYHATQYLPLVLKQYEWVDKIVVMNYRFKTVEPTTDNTREICEKFGHKDLTVESGEGLEQHEIRNRGLELLSDCDLAWTSDTDEIILPDDQNMILNRMCDRRPLCGLAHHAGCKIIDYNGDLYHASPQRQGYVTVMVAPKYVRFSRLRNLEHNIHEAKFPYATMHHLGLVFTPKVIDWKASWEYKEENHSRERLLNDWAVKRDVKPPAELLEFLELNNKKSTWGFRIEKVPYKEQE